MKEKTGAIFMTLGVCCVLAAGLLLWHNAREDRLAGEAAENIENLLQQQIAQAQANDGDHELTELAPAPEDNNAMPALAVHGYDYIGAISIPAIERELPVIDQCDLTRLKTAPCRYYGSVAQDDLVIAAHNYNRHFGLISQLSIGDQVVFTSINGDQVEYEVSASLVLATEATEEMVTGEVWDLTLFTCTYGGQERITVRCTRRETQE